MNIPTPYALPPTAACLYVYGRSAHGAAHDVHLPLVYEPGSRVEIPLTVATDEKRSTVDRAATLLQQAAWTFASTMPENPHEYTPRKTWKTDADFVFVASTIRRYGRREPYVPPGAIRAAYSETVLDAGSHFHWSGWMPIESTFWINRKPRASLTPATRIVDQFLTAEDARLLPIPTLPEGFAALPRGVTVDPAFRFGVATFGYQAERSLLPRLVRRRRVMTGSTKGQV